MSEDTAKGLFLGHVAAGPGGPPSTQQQQKDPTITNPDVGLDQRNVQDISDGPINPNRVGLEGGTYAGYVAPSRNDQPNTAGRPGDYYPGAEIGRPGNVVTPSEINPTLNVVESDAQTPSKPVGTESSTGFGPYGSGGSGVTLADPPIARTGQMPSGGRK